MADPRFFKRAGPFTLAQLAEATGALLQGTDCTITDIAPLETAAADAVSFFDNIKYLDAFRATSAGACFVKEKFAKQAPAHMQLLISENPYMAYAVTAQLFYPASFSSSISPRAYLAEGVKIGQGCRIEAGAWIGDGVEIGDHCFIGANATISHALIGHRVMIHPGVHIGQDGFGFAPSAKGLLKVPQLGRVLIGDDVEIGAGTCIDRGAGPDTVIMDGAKIDNLVQIGHNCHIGRYAIIVAQVGISGSTRVEDFAQIGGQVGIAGHLTIGKGAKLAAQSGIMRDIPSGESYGGTPAVPIRDFHRQTTALAKLIKKEG